VAAIRAILERNRDGTRLFLGGILPGLLLAIGLSVYSHLFAAKYARRSGRPTWLQRGLALRDGIVPILMPVFVVGSILAGIVTPTEAARRGCQLSLRVRGGRDQGRALFEFLMAQGIVGDWREPDVIRISPVPLYNRFADISRFVAAVQSWHDGRG